jgi:hypothetical protein
MPETTLERATMVVSVAVLIWLAVLLRRIPRDINGH